MNDIKLLGRLTNAPELKEVQAAVTTPGLPLLYPAKIIEMRQISLDALLLIS